MRTSTYPNMPYGNSAGHSLLRSIERMHTDMLEFKAEAEQEIRAVREEKEQEAKALREETERLIQEETERVTKTFREETEQLVREGIERVTKTLREEAERETKALKEELVLLRPLRETAVDIRRRFFAVFHRPRVPAPGDLTTISFGNRAAHSGDLITDVMLFRHQLIDCDETFKEIYGMDWRETDHLLGMFLGSSTPAMIISHSDIACF